QERAGCRCADAPGTADPERGRGTETGAAIHRNASRGNEAARAGLAGLVRQPLRPAKEGGRSGAGRRRGGWRSAGRRTGEEAPLRVSRRAPGRVANVGESRMLKSLPLLTRRPELSHEEFMR